MSEKTEFREVSPEDIGQLYSLIKLSTNHKTKLTQSSLQEALFGHEFDTGNPIVCEQSGVNFDPRLIQSNVAFCRALVIALNQSLIGYIIFHFHYSPWLGHSTYVDDIFVKDCHQDQELADSLIKGTEKLSKQLGINRLLFNDTIPGGRYLLRYKNIKALRNENTDWSVRRIHLG